MKREQVFINDQIRATEVRVVTDGSSEVMSKEDALKIAEEKGEDLILISPAAKPPVCKIMEYGKYVYQQKKHLKEQAQKQKQSNKELKEIKFGPNISSNDLDVKKKKIEELIEKGHKVKLSCFFKNRNIVHKDRGEVIMLKLVDSLSDIAKPDSLPKMVGRNMLCVVSPIKK